MPKAHIFMDNDAAVSGYACEHGLAVGLEFEDGEFWLWDTGKSGAWLDNATSMGRRPEDATGLALSHGHHDHTGGLPALRDRGFSAPIYGHPDVTRRRYRCRDGRMLREIGWRGGDVEVIGVSESRELRPGMVMHTDIVRRPGAFQAVDNFFFDEECSAPDIVQDDSFLLVDGEQGKAIILGCCHSGLGNSLATLGARTGLGRVDTIVGGLHLFESAPWAVEETIETLREWRVRRIFAGHCTGDSARGYLSVALPEVVAPLGAGTAIEL